jgi:hypothetical protein
MQIPSFKDAAYLTITAPYKILKSAPLAISAAIPSYLIGKIWTHSANILEKSPMCLGLHLITKSIVEGPSLIYKTILEGKLLEFLPITIQHQIFGMSTEAQKKAFQDVLCKYNSLEIATAELTKVPLETLKPFCGNKTPQTCAEDSRTNCPTPTSTNPSCLDVQSDIAMIQGYSRVLGSFLTIVLAFYFTKYLFSSDSKLNQPPADVTKENPLSPSVGIDALKDSTPKTTTSSKEDSHIKHVKDLHEPSQANAALEKIFSNPYLKAHFLTSLNKEAPCPK